ncbi:MAG: hypothetical protein ACRDVN_04015 [Jiangellaceae bacterium]
MIRIEFDSAHRIREARDEDLGKAYGRRLDMQSDPVRIGMVVEEAADQCREARL